MAEWSLHVPFVRALYHQVATPSQLGELGLMEVLNWTANALNRVDRAAFFQKFQDEHAVQYFYEPFLEAFDPDLRKELGVWYTPPEVVHYQVARVDTVLREELGLADGLADPNVVVLDPCCGTGAYLVEVLKQIAATLRDKSGDALIAADLKTAAMTRIFGFEILPAPFVVSHLQLGLMLHALGVPLSAKASKQERVGVYLTNALTGWEPPNGTKQHVLAIPELEAERDAAEHVKRDERVLVILGNPPYNAFAGVSPQEEQGLVEPYKTGLNTPTANGGWGIRKFNLDDLYIRFFRLAERRIAEMTGRGVVSFISNHSWVAEPSFVVLRKHLLDSFDRFWIENLHGNRKISEYAPDGRTSETIFAMKGFSVGIQQGVATSLWVKTGEAREADASAEVLFSDDLEEAKAEDRRAQLVSTLAAKDFNAAYTRATPSRENRYSFRPENVSDAYNTWPRLPELCQAAPSNGLMEKRGGALIDIDRVALESRMRDYFDRALPWEDYKVRHTALVEPQARFDPQSARRKAQAAESFEAGRIRRYALRPFEVRWCYYTGVRPVWNEPRPALWEQCFEGNGFVLSRMKPGKAPEGAPMYFCHILSDDHLLSPDAACFALRLKPTGEAKGGKGTGAMFAAQPKANHSPAARDYLAKLGIKDADADAETAGLIWMHALAVGYSPAYLAENADGIRRDWPRIPLPETRKTLATSADIGRQIAALLDTERDVAGVTTGTVEGVFKTMGALTKVGGDQLSPDAGDLAVTAGWGHAGKGGVTMPAKGRIVARPYEKAELEAISEAAKRRGSSNKKALELLGPDTRDVYLNDTAYWKNIPANVWEYYIGGYQVIKKWLSYREQKLLGRSLSPDEAREVTGMARRLTAIVLMQPALDKNYSKVKKAAYDWPR
jgi:predicted helicase